MYNNQTTPGILDFLSAQTSASQPNKSDILITEANQLQKEGNSEGAAIKRFEAFKLSHHKEAIDKLKFKEMVEYLEKIEKVTQLESSESGSGEELFKKALVAFSNEHFLPGFHYLLLAAMKLNPEAWWLTAIFFLELRKNILDAQLDETIFIYCKFAVEQGCEAALDTVGYCYEFGIGITQDLTKAADYYQQSLNKKIKEFNDSKDPNVTAPIKTTTNELEHQKNRQQDQREAKSAQPQLAILLKIGIGLLNVINLYHLLLAADKGDASAQCKLGFIYYEGMQIKKDKNKAYDYFNKSASQGYSRAQYNLGYWHDIVDLENENIDLNKAKEWYQLAADQDIEDALIRLKKLYDDGLIDKDDWLEKNKDKMDKTLGSGSKPALPILGKSEVKPNEEKNSVGCSATSIIKSPKSIEPPLDPNYIELLYKEGMKYDISGNNINVNIAAEFYIKAAQQGHVEAKRKLKALIDIGLINKETVPEALLDFDSTEESQHDDEITELKKQAEQGNVRAQCALGDYVAGNELYTKAAKWYGMAAAKEDAEGLYEMGHLYNDGLGVKENTAHALDLWRKAAAQNYGPALDQLEFMEKIKGHQERSNYDEKKPVQWTASNFKLTVFAPDSTNSLTIPSWPPIKIENFATVEPKPSESMQQKKLKPTKIKTQLESAAISESRIEQEQLAKQNFTSGVNTQIFDNDRLAMISIDVIKEHKPIANEAPLLQTNDGPKKTTVEQQQPITAKSQEEIDLQAASNFELAINYSNDKSDSYNLNLADRHLKAISENSIFYGFARFQKAKIIWNNREKTKKDVNPTLEKIRDEIFLVIKKYEPNLLQLVSANETPNPKIQLTAEQQKLLEKYDLSFAKLYNDNTDLLHYPSDFTYSPGFFKQGTKRALENFSEESISKKPKVDQNLPKP